MNTSAWYDLSVRINSVQAIADYAQEALPDGLQGSDGERVNRACSLILAMQDILNLMQQDVALIQDVLDKKASCKG